jgi:hypothetical protein
MPFRTSIITYNENINSMMYHQMAGRAGRRGLDKEGNVVLVGYTWNQIKNITTSSIPNINGCDTMFYGACYADKILSIDTKWDKIKTNYLLDKITNEDAVEFYENIDTNLIDAWDFAVSDNISFNHMMWRFRHTEDCFRVAFLLNYLRKIFKNCNPKNENTQIECVLLIANYIDTYKSSGEYVLKASESAYKYDINGHLERLGLDIEYMIDSRVFESIKINHLVDTPTKKEKSILRERLLNFGEKIRSIQHYFFHVKETALTQILSKILTRIWWVYHSSSPIMEPINRYKELS